VRKIKRNDEVIVIKGRDRGKRGEVREVRPDGRLVVTGIQLVKKHQKPNPMTNQRGGIVEREAPIEASNVAIWNAETGKADRVGFRIEERGGERVKVRFFKKTGKTVDR
jgi:large subunit ribosomal protein L24